MYNITKTFRYICFVFSEGICNFVKPPGRSFLTTIILCLCQLRNVTSMAEDIFWDPCHFHNYSKYEAVPKKIMLHRPHFQLVLVLLSSMGRDSSVGIATGYGLDGPEIESRWETRFSAPVQTGPGLHPASYTMSTGSLSQR